jgi:hypothetical protein
MADVYVFGDSHWRVFFPFVNHGSPGAIYEQDGVKTIDMVANELSGTTMYGLLNPNSRHGGRARILGDLDQLGPVDNVGLVFGEVDARYHWSRYYVNGGLSHGKIWETIARYVRFVQEDLLNTGRVRENVFIYHGFEYPKKGETILQPGQFIGDDWERAQAVNYAFSVFLRTAFTCLQRVVPILPNECLYDLISEDGVHFEPNLVYEKYTLPAMRERLTPRPRFPRNLPL